MKIGGYQIIDLGGKKLTSNVGMTYNGLYEKIEGTNKPILVSGINLGGKEYHDTWCEFNVNGSNYEGLIYGNKIVIQDNDVITVTFS